MRIPLEVGIDVTLGVVMVSQKSINPGIILSMNGRPIMILNQTMDANFNQRMDGTENLNLDANLNQRMDGTENLNLIRA